MEEELQKLGLNEHEAKVYLAALSLGPSSARSLADITKIKRPTVYLALENLAKQGLIYETKNSKTLFTAEKPQKLEKLTKRMRRQTIDAEILLESLLPILNKVPKQYAEEPQTSFYSGINGIKNVLLEVSATTNSWHFFGSTTQVLKNISPSDMREILEEGSKFRTQKNRSKIYFITDSGIHSVKGFEDRVTPWREIKILPGTINASSGFIIYEDKLVILNFSKNPFATVIKSKDVVEVVKVMYQLIWKSLN